MQPGRHQHGHGLGRHSRRPKLVQDRREEHGIGNRTGAVGDDDHGIVASARKLSQRRAFDRLRQGRAQCGVGISDGLDRAFLENDRSGVVLRDLDADPSAAVVQLYPRSGLH
ncbi:MAG: hypothetical protein IIA30_10635 [Myxococcales bacterium]|nr:hypothetical protein [Myxococcales bacterium]